MKLYIRAHDLGVQGEEAVVKRLLDLELDGVQLVAYKCLPDVSYEPGAIAAERAEALGECFRSHHQEVALLGAYFNPVHSDLNKRKKCIQIFEDYLKVANELGTLYVGSETGSYNDDKWTYHPKNHSDEALQIVVETFQRLCDVATTYGTSVAIEGAFGHVCFSPERLLETAQKISRPNLKFIFDLYNYLDISNVESRWDLLERGLTLFGKDIIAFHIKDFVVTDGALKQVPVGTGMMDFERMLKQISEINPEAHLVLEGTVGEAIPNAVNLIKSIIKKL